jgi:hypothetical protein
MPFHSTGHAPVAAIDNTLSCISSSISAGHSAAVTIAHTSACNLEPFTVTSAC